MLDIFKFECISILYLQIRTFYCLMNAYFVYNIMVLGTELRSLNILCTLPLSYIPSLVYDLKNMHPIYVESSAVDLIS